MNDELKQSCKIIADLLATYNYPLDDSNTLPICDDDEIIAAKFLEKHGFAVFEREEYTVRIFWEKLEEKP